MFYFLEKQKIPLLLNRVYQRVFTSTYLLANILNTAYPPPDMLSSGELDKPNPNGHVEWGDKEETKPEEKPAEKKKKVKTKAKR